MQLQPPGYRERLLIVGENGTGKSELSFALEAAGNYRKAIYIDHKGDCDPWRYKLRAGQLVELPPPVIVKSPTDRWGWRNQRIVYRPPHGSYLHTDRGFAEVLEWLFQKAVNAFDHKQKRAREPFIVIVPEVLLFGPLAQKALGEMASAGRNYQLGLWTETQRPKRIMVVLRSEAWRIYAFPLGYEDDEREILKYTKGRLSLDAFRELEDSITRDDPHPFYEIVRRTEEGARITVRRLGSLELPTRAA